MANTRSDVAVPASAWTDLYAASSIAVGTAVTVYNKGSNPFNIVIAATTPAGTTMGIPVNISGQSGATFSVPASASGLWVYSAGRAGVALVQD